MGVALVRTKDSQLSVFFPLFGKSSPGLAEGLQGDSVGVDGSFGKDIEALRSNRLDLISISSHKIYGPKGIGALVVRRRGYKRVPLTALIFGGGQERGLRPGTLPVAQIAALGKAAEMAVRNHAGRVKRCQEIKSSALASLGALNIRINGDPEHTHAHVLNFAVPGIDSEAMIVALKDLVAISNGSACTSASYTPSHVMLAMGRSEDEANEALRFSWCHLTDDVDWNEIACRIKSLR